MRRPAVVLALLAVLVLGGCGIPAESGVRVLANGPSAGPAAGDDNAAPPPAVTRNSGTKDYPDFVTDFLATAAGDPEGWLDRVTKFMTPEAKRRFKPSTAASTIQVVRPSQKLLYTPGESQVTLYAYEVGTLDKDGVLVPSTDPSEHRYTFQVVLHSDGLYIDWSPQMPQVILLSEEALEKYYQPHTIYFWNRDDSGLVPDLRWMPLLVPAAQRPTMILNWLADGPADWLGDVAEKLPSGTTVPDNIPAATDGKLEISLNAQPTTADDRDAIDRLRRQLQWSLRPDVPSTLELKIAHQDRTFTNEPYLESNAAFRLNDVPDKFVVANGVIRRLADSAHPADPVPVLKPEANRGVQAAALSASADHAFAAVVTPGGKGVPPILRVAAAPIGKQADLRLVTGLKGPLDHPLWAITAAGDAATAVGLIISQGRLYSFGADGGPARPVDLQNNASGPITAVSVAPDGHRIVLVAGGKLYRGELTTTDGVAVPALSRILPPELASVSAVAWSSEGWLTVAGVQSDGRTSILDVTVDGAVRSPRLPDIGSDQVTYLAAYPASPLGGKTISTAVTYEAGGKAWNAAGYPARILPSELAGAPATTPPNAPLPSAPFFLQ